MGIQGLLKHLGSGKRVSLATLSAQHYVQHERPLRLAIDVSIWLFQIQAGQGGTNPALRTFYYRLLRLISLNIHPLFVFDGPNKPLFKRNKRVGGSGVRIASVPEFLAKQLLKQFGFPIHIAPGEAEAECALLQRMKVVDAVLSEDVDTMMFGSTLTFRNWTAEGSQKTPTHVNVYDSSIIEKESGLDCEAMVLVALMSGGDYIPEGIPGCGPKFAVAAAKAGFGRRLCSLDKSDTRGLTAWREDLQMEFRTNASKFFSRRNTTLVVPTDFPNFEVLGYYTHPCVSNDDQVQELRRKLQWDLPLDLVALREFAGDAFEWYNRGGAIKFVRNLAPALLLRALHIRGRQQNVSDLEEQARGESSIMEGIHNTRTHITTDNSTEMRVSYIPAKLVPIDMSLEPLDDPDDIAMVQQDEDEVALAVVDTEQLDHDGNVPPTPSKRVRTFRPYEEAQPEKMWVLREWVQLGCPLMLEDYEAAQRAPKAPARIKAKTTQAGSRKGKTKTRAGNMPANALMRHVRVTKATSALLADDEEEPTAARKSKVQDQPSETILSSSPSAAPNLSRRRSATQDVPQTPSRRKRGTADITTPQTGRSAITGYFSATPRGQTHASTEIISLLSSSPIRVPEVSPGQKHGGCTARPRKTMRTTAPGSATLQEVSNNLGTSDLDLTTKVRRPRMGLQKSLSLPVSQSMQQVSVGMHTSIDCLDLAESPAHVRPFNTTHGSAPGQQLDEPVAMTTSSSCNAVPVCGVAAVDLSYNVPVEVPSARPKKTLRPPRAVVGTRQEVTSTKSYRSACTSQMKPLIGQSVARPAKRLIMLRESLDGAWKTSTDTLDLSGGDAETRRGNARSWRVSGVDMLDLTGD